MIDRLSLDQLRAFIAAVEEGSFSGAGRRLRRAQSAISESVATLEGQLGVALFDRSGRTPRLTAAGRTLLADARGIAAGVDFMLARAKGLSAGLEPEVAAALDLFVPLGLAAAAARDFRDAHPGLPLRLSFETLGGVVEAVADGRAAFGVVGPQPALPSTMTAEQAGAVIFVMVAAAGHPLAAAPGPVPRGELARHVQIVLSERVPSGGREIGVVAAATWRLTDLAAKRAFLLEGLGWGGMPRHMVEDDLAAGRLVLLDTEELTSAGREVPLYVIYPTAAPPGPAGRWLAERLKEALRLRPAERGPEADPPPP